MKSGFRIFTLLLFFFAISERAYDQSQPIDFNQQLKLPQVVPASPDAAAIEKFGNIPVSYATGVPDISIPIWTIKCGNLSWPVSLSYHAGGIRVDESASSAGLGWSINGQGSISRSRAGRPDEENSSEPTYSSVTDLDDVYLYAVLKGTADSEQDVFNFNFNGRSGKFVINQDGSILQIPFSNLKITYTTGLNSFTITDENGVVYLFDQKEMTSSQTYPSESTPTYYTSSWYLTKVELPDKKNTIQFTYTSAGTSSDAYNSFTQAVGEKYIESPPIVAFSDRNDRSSSSTAVFVGMMKLSNINFPNGSLVFNYDASARQDLGSGNDVTNKLSTITINKVINTISTQAKKFSFYQSYFYDNPGGGVNTTRLYRLKLDSLSESGMTFEPTPKKYKFQYNTTPMVPRGNYGQDIWGYNNGVFNNPSLLQSQNITFFNDYYNLSYTIGDANRNVDTAKMKACMLSSITYPTGGKTVFTFEPHVYNTDLTVTTVAEQETHIFGDQPSPQVSTTTFTYPANAVPMSARLFVDMSKFNFPGVTFPSVVGLKDLTTGGSIYLTSHPYPDQRYTRDMSVTLEIGHNYELKATVYTNTSNSQLNASIKVTWSNATTQPDIRRGGGLRIKEMIHYTDNTLAGKESYIYDTAVTLTPFYLIERTYSEVHYRLGHPGVYQTEPICDFYYSPLCRVYHSGPVYAISTAMGSPMLYRKVQKVVSDAATGAVNGKSEYLYDVFKDQNYNVGSRFTGGQYMLVPMITNDWQNGFLTSETHYKFSNGVYSMIQKTENIYSQYSITQSNSLRAQAKIIREGCSAFENQTTVSTDIFYFPFPIYSGSKRLAQQTVTQFDDNQNKIETVTTNYYNSSKYDFPTKILTIDSKANQDSVTFKHSPDFASVGNVYEKMEQQNILAPVIQQKSYNGATLLNTVKNNYRDWYNDGKIISPDSIQASVLNNALETRLKYTSYDDFNNPLSVRKAMDAITSYIWGYSKAYPIAQAINADNNSIAYTSFEEDGKGNWTYTGTSFVDPTAPTGNRCYTLGTSITKSGLSTSTTYIVSYWKKSGTVAVNGTTPVTGRTVGGWTYYEHKVINPVGGLITVSGTSGIIDELRLYPASNAQMTTYTYAPLVGVTSQCDANNRIVYYEYDELQRLILIRDQDRNILKKFAYNYNGQTEYPNIYYNDVAFGMYYKQGCTGCQIGSLVTYTVPAGLYLSTLSLAEANSIAQADVYANGQAYANANGICSTPGSATVTGTNQITNRGFTIKFHNNCTGSDYTYTLNPNATNITLSPSPPVGNYNITFTRIGGPGTYTFKANGFVQTTSLDPVFSGIDVLSSGNQVIIQP